MRTSRGVKKKERAAAAPRGGPAAPVGPCSPSLSGPETAAAWTKGAVSESHMHRAAAATPAASCAAERQELVVSGTALLVAVVLLPLVTFAVTFPVAHSVNEHRTDRFLTFLSNTIDYPPASCIGTFGLVLALAALLAMMVLRHVLLIERLSRASLTVGAPSALTSDGVFVSATDRITAARERQLSAWRRSSERCLGVGCVALLGGLLVCSFQPHANFNVHMSGAAAFFLGGAVFTTWQTVLDSRLAARLPHCDPSRAAALSAFSAIDGPGLRVRRAVAVLTVLTYCLGFCVGFLAQGQRYLGWAWIGEVMPESDRDDLISVYGPVVELSLLLCFVFHFASLLPAVCRQRVRLVLTVSWDEPGGEESFEGSVSATGTAGPINRGLAAPLTGQGTST